MYGILCPRVGESLDIVLRSKIKGWGNSQVCKITGRQPRGFDTFLNPYVVLKIGNLATKKASFEALELFCRHLGKITEEEAELLKKFYCDCCRQPPLVLVSLWDF